MADYESKVENISQAFEDYQAQAEETHLKFEKELSAAQARFEESAKREAACTKQIEVLRQQCHEAEVRAASTEATLAEIEKYNKKLEEQVKQLG